MAQFKIAKVTTLPTLLEPSTMYLVQGSEAAELQIYVTNTLGTATRHILTKTEIQALISATSSSGADKLVNARHIASTGDVAWSVMFDGSADVSAISTLTASGVIAGTYNKVDVDAKGRVISGQVMTSADIPNLPGTKITSDLSVNTTGNAATATKLAAPVTINGVSFDGSSAITITASDPVARIAVTEKGVANGVATLDATGTIPSSQLPSYVDSVLEFADLAAFPATGETSKIYVATDTGRIYRWGTTVYTEISSAGTSDQAIKLSNPRTISSTGDATWTVTFDGSANVDGALTLTNVATAGTYAKVTIDSKGRVITGGALTAADIPNIGGEKITSAISVDTTGTADYAKKLKNAITINNVPFDGSTNITISASDAIERIPLVQKGAANGVATLDATGLIPIAQIPTVASATVATKLATPVTINSVAFDGSSNITINAVDSTERIASTEKGIANGVASLDANGKIPSDQLPSFVDAVIERANLAAFPTTGESSKIYIALDTDKVYRWGGTTYVEISSAGVADKALQLSNLRSIASSGDVTWTVNFDGSANVTAAATLANTAVTAGTYNNTAGKISSFTVDAKGRITGVGAATDISVDYTKITNKPTTVAGYGITDAQALLVSGTNIKTINTKSIIGAGNLAISDILVSGTDIKTINNTSLLGSGNISISQTFPATGIAVSTGTAWGTSLTAPVGAFVGTTDTQTLTNKTLEATKFTKAWQETVNTIAASGTAQTLSLDTGTVQFITLTANCTFTFPAVAAGKGFSLFLKQDATGNRTVTWPANTVVKWPAATAPTLTTTANAVDRLVFVSDGTYWYGALAGANFG